MRKGIWPPAAVFVLLASGVLLGVPRVGAADGQVAMVEGSQNDPNTWRFNPQEITVSAGSTVVWHNSGQQQHTATAEDNSFASAYLNAGQEFKFKFAAPGDFKYFCEPHKALGMVGVIHVTGASTPTTASTTATTQPGTATTATTAASGQPTTTTASGASTSSTTATTAGGGTTTTTLAPALTPTSAPDSASSTTTTTAAPGASAEGAEGARKSSRSEKSSPIGIAFAAVATLLLGAVSAKLLASKP